MATILTWRNDGTRPHCQMVLDGGDQVSITLAASGVVIARISHGERRGERLFRGDADLATRICLGLLAGKPPRGTTPLDILAVAVAGFATAEAVERAFADAAAALRPPGFTGLLRRWFGARGAP